MRDLFRFSLLVIISLTVTIVSAKTKTDTIVTGNNDKIIITYNVTVTDNEMTICFNQEPRIIPTEGTRNTCKGKIGKLKAVIFDRNGNYGENTKWKGNISKRSFMVPSGMSYENSRDGFYILGETRDAMKFNTGGNTNPSIDLPVYLAMYSGKHEYTLLGAGRSSLKVTGSAPKQTTRTTKVKRPDGTYTEEIIINDVDITGDNEDLINALNTVRMVEEMIANQTEYPFSSLLQAQILDLRSLKNSIKDPELSARIDEVLKKCDDKERELREQQNASALAAQADEQARLEQQKAEEAARQKEAEEKAREQEEKSQKRTLWMIIGGVILAVLGFVGNAFFKHFSDISNQKRVFEMQQSIANQAEHAAKRRAREVVRNKAHQAVNKGRSKLRVTLNSRGTSAKPKPQTTNPQTTQRKTITPSTRRRPNTQSTKQETKRRTI